MASWEWQLRSWPSSELEHSELLTRAQVTLPAYVYVAQAYY